MLSLRHSLDVRSLASQVAILQKGFLFCRKNLATKPEEESFKIWEEEEDPEEAVVREAKIEESRNKSKLFPKDFNKQHDRMPYDEPIYPHLKTLIYRRRSYGKFGEASKVNPSILWPSKIELEAMKEYESVAQPFSFQELVARSKEKKRLEEQQRLEEEAIGLERVKNIKKEILEFHKRVAVKKKAAMEIVEKKNQLIEEVRRRIGYKVDTNDKRFKEMLAEVQEEEKKRLKASKKAIREEKQKQLVDTLIKNQLKSAEEEDKTEEPNT